MAFPPYPGFYPSRRNARLLEASGVLQCSAQQELDLGIQAAKIRVAQRCSASCVAGSKRSRNAFRSAMLRAALLLV
jgi:hypothetical protein